MKMLAQLHEMKLNKEKITMMTAYDYPSAKQVEAANIDTILVGDSLGMTVLGLESTVQVTKEHMIHHTKAVRRGAPNTFVIVDVPFGCVGISTSDDLQHLIELYKETNANAVKVEGNHPKLIRAASTIGLPVVAHLGLTPQSVGITGFKMQAKEKDSAESLIKTAVALEEAGAVMLVLEAIPEDLAAFISTSLKIPVIGIGAGNKTDGQVLVYHDVLTYGQERKPKFVKQYGDFTVGIDALRQYHEEVKLGKFPTAEYTYKAKVMDEVQHDTNYNNN